MERIEVVLLLAVGILCSSSYGYGLSRKQFASKVVDKANNFIGKQKQVLIPIPLDIPENAFRVENSAFSFSCEDNGLFPYPTDCTMGVRCMAGIDAIFACSDGLHFNNLTKKCEEICSAHCDPNLACRCGWKECDASADVLKQEGRRPLDIPENAFPVDIPDISFPCGDDGLFPYPRDCTLMVMCRGGRHTVFTCTDLLHFSNTTKRCENFCSARCDPYLACFCDWGECQNPTQLLTTKDSETEDLKPMPSLTCRHGDGLFANREDCNQYSECINGRLFFKFCPPGLHFNKRTKTCDTPCKAKCDPSLTCRRQKVQKPKVEASATEDSSLMESSKKEIYELRLKFVCFYDGLFPNPKNCRKYINCLNGTSYELSCPPGKHFNRETAKCETPCSAKCEPNLVCNWRRFKNAFQGEMFKSMVKSLCSKDGIYRSPIDCSVYLKCEDGEVYAFQCPSGQHFNNETLQCEEPCNAYCDLSLAEKCGWRDITDSEIENVTTETPKELCSKEGEYLEKNPLDCKTYFKCIDGDADLIYCPEGQHFNENTLQCEEPCDAHCDSSLAKECGWEEFQDVFDFQCPGNGLYPNTACENFIQCTGGQAYLINCPYGQHYDPYTQRCTTPCEAKCAPNYEDFCTDEEKSHSSVKVHETFHCATDGYFVNPTACENFLQCFAGTAYIIDCPPNLHYSPVMEICMSPCDAKCASNYDEFCKAEEWDRKIKTQRSGSVKQQFPLVPEFICNEDGVYPNPGECTSYIHCLDEEGYVRDCPKGLHFSEKTLQCETPCEARCDSSLGTLCGWNDIWAATEHEQKSLFDFALLSASDSPSLMYDFTCMNDGVYKNPENCSSFIQCSNGHSYIMLCPESLHFNEEKKMCDYPCNARCDAKMACHCGWDTCDDNKETNDDEDESIPEIDCEAEEDEGPCDSKDLYFRYFYDVWSGRCQPLLYSGCGGNSNNFISKSECEKICRDKMLEGFTCPEENGLFGHSPDCISYYHCKQGIPTRKRCPRGTAFDHKKSKCVTEYEATCVYECRDKDAVYPYEKDCRKYIDCVNGISKLEKCPPGKAFDPVQRDCIDKKKVNTCF